MAEFRDLLWLVTPGRQVVIKRVQATYLDLFNQTFKLKENKPVNTDISFSYRMGIISIRGGSFSENSANLTRNFEFRVESRQVPQETMVAICDLETNNNLIIPLFRGECYVTPSDIAKVKHIKFNLEIHITKSELTFSSPDGLYKLCRDKREHLVFRWELPETTLQRKQEKVRQEKEQEMEEQRIKQETTTDAILNTLAVQGEKISQTLSRSLAREPVFDQLSEIINDNHIDISKRFDNLVINRADKFWQVA